jgi:hexosaminidase
MNKNKIFQEIEPVIKSRVVHLDLKGTPPTFERLMKLLEYFASAKYTAILVEFEDMFPWTVDMRFRCSTCYSEEQIRMLNSKVSELGLEIIPLVQTLGHMETFLKWPEYGHLRNTIF